MKAADAIIIEARKRFKTACEAESEIRAEALKDLRFRAGEQWDTQIQSQRESEQRPCLTINRLPQFIKQVTNEQRQSRPAVKIDPVDDGTDVETAEVVQGLARHIEVASDADVAYDCGFESMVTIGFGFWRVVTEYQGEDSFDQCIRIKRILNPFAVYCDPGAREPDKSDARWCFVVEDLSKEDFMAEYPKAAVSGMDDFRSIGDGSELWFQGHNIRVAEYFRVVETDETLHMYPDGSMQTGGDGIGALKSRTVRRRKIEWFKINGLEILERGEWAGRYIPVVGVYGDELEIDGKKFLAGMVRFARDPQRMYNYWVSAATETIALAPRAPFVGAAGQFEGFEKKWETANVRNWPYLEYNPESFNGTPIAPPQRNVYEPPVQAIMAATAQADNDLKATTGIYDASLGSAGPQESGRAILARQRESDTANLNYIDNMSRAIRHTARILVDLIPKIYDAPRVVRILKPETDGKVVAINQPTLEKGVERMYDLSTGKYDITVSVGPSYTTKRQEAVASMIELTKTYPMLMEVAGDLLVKNMDWPGAQEIAGRLKKLLPPAIQDGEEGEQPIPPKAQAQMAQLSQQNQQLTELVNELSKVIETKQMDIDSKERIAALQADVQLTKIQADAATKGATAIMNHEFQQANRMIDAVYAPEPKPGSANG